MESSHPSDALRGRLGDHLAGRTVALGVDAARGAPGAVRVARELLRLGAAVQPLPVPAAADWVPAVALEYAAGRAPQRWPPPGSFDAVLLAPLGAGLAAKLRLGLADTAASAAALGHLGRAPVLAAPAPGLAPEAAAAAEALGVRLVPDAFDAHGEPRPEAVAAEVAGALSRSPLRGRRALVVGGGAFEPVDAMRVVAGEPDPGLARALALELRRRGARVTALLGPGAQPPGPGERAYATLGDLGAAAALLGPHDVVLAEDALPRLAPRRHPGPGKIPSGQAHLALELAPAPGLDELLAPSGPPPLRFRRDPAAPLHAQARALADQAAAAPGAPWMETYEAAAFAPGHVSAFFEIHDTHPDLARRGSRGAGINLDQGVLSHAVARKAEAQRVDVWLDGAPAEAPVTAQAVRNLVGAAKLHVEVRSQVQLPVSQGFGMSAAGALSAAMALAKALRLPRSDAVIAAHKADLQLRGGLGDVVAQVQGGVELRVAPGLPPWGSVQRVMGEAELVLCVLAGPLETRKVLGDAEMRKRIQKAGKAAVEAFAAAPSLPALFRVGKKFAADSGLATLEILRAIRAVELEGGMASQSMLGNSVFAWGPSPDAVERVLRRHGETWRVAIEPTGARVVELQRAGPAQGGAPPGAPGAPG